MGAFYIANKGLEGELMGQKEYLDGLEELAEGIVEEVQAIAPVDTGFYKQSIRVTRGITNVYVGTYDYTGHIVEWGSIWQPAQAPIRRGARAAGFRLNEIPK